ncbi:hypothetical protein [Lacunimicrobium album]
MGVLELAILFLFPLIVFVVMPSRVPSAPGSLFTFVLLLFVAAFGLFGYRSVMSGDDATAQASEAWQADDILEEVLRWL